MINISETMVLLSRLMFVFLFSFCVCVCDYVTNKKTGQQLNKLPLYLFIWIEALVPNQQWTSPFCYMALDAEMKFSEQCEWLYRGAKMRANFHRINMRKIITRTEWKWLKFLSVAETQTYKKRLGQFMGKTSEKKNTKHSFCTPFNQLLQWSTPHPVFFLW